MSTVMSEPIATESSPTPLAASNAVIDKLEAIKEGKVQVVGEVTTSAPRPRKTAPKAEAATEPAPKPEAPAKLTPAQLHAETWGKVEEAGNLLGKAREQLYSSFKAFSEASGFGSLPEGDNRKAERISRENKWHSFRASYLTVRPLSVSYNGTQMNIKRIGVERFTWDKKTGLPSKATVSVTTERELSKGEKIAILDTLRAKAANL